MIMSSLECKIMTTTLAVFGGTIAREGENERSRGGAENEGDCVTDVGRKSVTGEYCCRSNLTTLYCKTLSHVPGFSII
jgi:hypothetical protein